MSGSRNWPMPWTRWRKRSQDSGLKSWPITRPSSGNNSGDSHCDWTHQREKREYLRNALLNIAKGITSDEIKQQVFLNAIEAFTPTHIKVLNVIWRGGGLNIGWDKNSIPMMQRKYGAAIEILAPEVKGQTSLIGAVLAHLRNRGFSNLGGPVLAFPQGDITNLGIEFLTFVLSPEDLPR